MHCSTCAKVRVSMIYRHNAIVNYLLDHLPKQYEAVPVDVKHDSFEQIRVDCRQPGIRFIIETRTMIMDVAFCKDENGTSI